jgi:hypothetical protein
MMKNFNEPKHKKPVTATPDCDIKGAVEKQTVSTWDDIFAMYDKIPNQQAIPFKRWLQTNFTCPQLIN